MQNRIFIKVIFFLVGIVMFLGACQGKQPDTKKIEQTQEEQGREKKSQKEEEQDKEGNRDKQQVAETTAPEVPVDTMAKIETPFTNKESTEEEIYVHWSWDGLKNKSGSMRGMRIWLNGEGLEHKKKLTIQSPYIIGRGKYGEANEEDMVPVYLMRENDEGNLYFLCNVDEKKPWKKSYLVTDASGRELFGGKLNLKELTTKGDGTKKRWLWLTDMEIYGDTIVLGYKSSGGGQYYDKTKKAKCGVLFIDTKTDTWSNRELNTEHWWTDESYSGFDMELHDGAIYSIYKNKFVYWLDYNTRDEKKIELPDIAIPEPAYGEWVPGDYDTDKSVLVGSITYKEGKLYLLDVYGRLYACDVKEGAFKLLYTDGEHSYPAYTLARIQVSDDGHSLYAAYWEGGDECYPEGTKPYFWIRYQLK